MPLFDEGKTFWNYEELEEALQSLKGQKFTKHGKRIEHINKILDSSKRLREDLVYKNLTLKCVHYGKHKRRPTDCSRPNQKSCKKNCGAFINLVASRKLDCLVVSKVHLEHNHSLFSDSDPNYSMNRRLSKEEKDEAIGLLSSGHTVKAVVKIVREKFGKPVIDKDIYNLCRVKTIKTETREATQCTPFGEELLHQNDIDIACDEYYSYICSPEARKSDSNVNPMLLEEEPLSWDQHETKTFTDISLKKLLSEHDNEDYKIKSDEFLPNLFDTEDYTRRTDVDINILLLDNCIEENVSFSDITLEEGTSVFNEISLND